MLEITAGGAWLLKYNFNEILHRKARKVKATPYLHSPASYHSPALLLLHLPGCPALVLLTGCGCSCAERGLGRGVCWAYFCSPAARQPRGFERASRRWWRGAPPSVWLLPRVMVQCSAQPVPCGVCEAIHGRRAGHTFVFVEHGPKYLIVLNKIKSYGNSC